MKRQRADESEAPDRRDFKQRRDTRESLQADGKLEVRVLCHEVDTPIIIGKGGSNAKQIRQDHGVLLRVTQDRNSQGERLCLLKGPPINCAQALESIAKLLVDNADQIASKTKQQHAPGQTTMTIIFHESQAGAVIGKGGAIAKQVFNKFKGKFKVSDDPLDGSTDKALFVTGEPEVIGQAYALVLQQLYDIAPRMSGPPRNYLENSGEERQPPPRYEERRDSFQERRGPDRYEQRAPYWEDRRAPPPPPAAYQNIPPPPRETRKTERIIIPNSTAPLVIGPGGATVRTVEERSGCNISLAEQSRTVPEDRIVNITGSPDAIERAVALIRDIVEGPLRNSRSSAPNQNYTHQPRYPTYR